MRPDRLAALILAILLQVTVMVSDLIVIGVTLGLVWVGYKTHQVLALSLVASVLIWTWSRNYWFLAWRPKNIRMFFNNFYREHPHV